MPEHDDRAGGLSETTPQTAALDYAAAGPELDNDRGTKQPLWVWLGLGALVLAALFVVFVLPGIVQNYELPLERRVDLAAPTQQTTTPDTGVSPFQEAQRARDRKAAQDVLAQLLEQQTRLDALEVSLWAAADYERAIADATQGDEFYRTQEFEAAQQAYAAGLATLTQILDSVPVVLEQRLVSGEQALIALDAPAAIAAFDLARSLEDSLFDESAMVPVDENSPARVGLRRALVLEELNGLFDTAELVADNPREQVAILEQAVNLDPYSEQAAALLAAAKASLLERRFAQAMSEGYARLQAGEPDEAIARFEAAAKLGINADEARAAIVQTETELTNAQIAALQQAAQTAESNEAWQAAVVEYEAIVALDGTLPSINEALDYASKRARLDALLVAALDAPERFAEPAVFDETRDVYFTGRAIDSPGPRLIAQLDELQALLEASQIPLSIRFISDGLTEVTVLRVSELGTFEATRLDLKPGRYAAVGRRAGFREVREEFTVGFGLTPAVVIVRCDEPINAALGR